MIHGIIGDDFGGLDSATLVAEIKQLTADPIVADLNSRGGSVYDGLSIYNALAAHPSKVVIEITGVAASMGSAIAMAGDTVRMAKNAQFMIHDPWNAAVGNADDLRRAADELERAGQSLAGIYAGKTGLPESQITDMMAATTWLNAEEALAKGFVDEITGASDPEAFADLDVSELANVPAALSNLIREGRQMAQARAKGTEGATPPKGKESTQTPPATDPPKDPSGQEPVDPKGATPDVAPQVAAALEAHRVAERDRRKGINAIRAKYHLPEAWARERFDEGDTVEEAQAKVADALVDLQDKVGGPSWIPGGVGVGRDEVDKRIEGVTNWLVMKAGQTRLFPKDHVFDPGEFRGMSLLDLARDSLARAGISTRGLGKMEIAGLALGRGPRAEQAGLGTRSDFPVLLENVLHKMLEAAYGTIPDTWRLFCAEGSVSDFRPHPRLRLGSFSQLDDLLESGEFKQKHFPDAEKESIQAATKGNIVGLTRQAIVNDDVDGFSRLVTMLGRAAALSIEVDVYATLALNSGLGPVLDTDSKTLFHADHGNVGAGAAITVAALDADRVLMASQQDPEGNEFLDLRPAVLVVPIGLGGQARVLNSAEFDIDAVDPGTDEGNKFMMPNRVRGLFRDIVDTPRISGTRRYLFADPAIAPVLEVVFLDGQSAPVLETEQGFDYDGVRWRVRFDYGVDAIDFRGATTDAGQ